MLQRRFKGAPPPMSLPPSPRPPPRQPSPAEAGVLTQPKPCGECSACCKILPVRELNKPAGVWCNHVVQGHGCGIYADRPNICRGYQCLWTVTAPLDERWRPDRAGFVLQPGAIEGEVEVVVDPDRPDAWRREPYYSQIKQISDVGRGGAPRVLVYTQGHVIVVFPETDIDLGRPNGMPNIAWGYEMQDGRPWPYARYTYPDGPEA
jgi:hypothetical protein